MAGFISLRHSSGPSGKNVMGGKYGPISTGDKEHCCPRSCLHETEELLIVLTGTKAWSLRLLSIGQSVVPSAFGWATDYGQIGGPET